MNQQVVVEWLKANVLSIVFVVLTIAFLVALPLVARGMNANVRAEIEDRGRSFDEMSRLERTQVEIAGSDGMVESHQVVVNQRLLEKYREYVEQQREDSREIYQAALAHNQKDRGVLMPELFPEPPDTGREVLPERFHEQLLQAYDNLLASVGAGAPPDGRDIRDALERREFQYRSQVLQRDAEETLPSDEQQELQQQLTSYRLLRYQEAAETLVFYMTLDALDLPEFDYQPMDELFRWQWRYWIHTDLLHALYRANDGDTLLRGPVKRVKRIAMTQQPDVDRRQQRNDRQSRGARGSGADGGIGGGIGGGVGSGVGVGTGAGERRNGQQDTRAAEPIDPTAEVPIDYGHSLTGRRSNHLYDVKYVRLDLVLDSRRIPEVIDSLSTQNFITVLDVQISPGDPYRDARRGYLYGDVPVSNVSLTVETIWLREWMAAFMPQETRERLGVMTETDEAG